MSSPGIAREDGRKRPDVPAISTRKAPCHPRRDGRNAVSFRSAAAYGSRLHKRVYARLQRAMGRDDVGVCIISSLLLEYAAQRVVAVPGDVGDAPAVLELDEIVDHGGRNLEIAELGGGARFVGRDVAPRDIDRTDLPILPADEGIGVERGNVVALLRVLAILDHQR